MCIQSYLKSRQVDFEPLLHAPASSASRRAHWIHVPGIKVAKSVLVKSGEAFLLTVLPATSWIDLARLSQILGSEPITLATEDQADLIFGDCQRGALPPFGSLYGLKTFIDLTLVSGLEMVCAGNQRHEGYRLRLKDYVTIERPIQVSFATTQQVEGSASRRRAG